MFQESSEYSRPSQTLRPYGSRPPKNWSPTKLATTLCRYKRNRLKWRWRGYPVMFFFRRDLWNAFYYLLLPEEGTHSSAPDLSSAAVWFYTQKKQSYLAEKFWIISTEQNPYWRFGVFTTIPVIEFIFYLVKKILFCLKFTLETPS